MKASAVILSLHSLIPARQPTFLWGGPGLGKSDIVRLVAKQRNVPLQDVRALLLDPVDLRGLPYLSEDRQSKWATPDFLPRGGEGILFLDELNSAPPMVQASCYQLVLDRKLGEYTLPDGWAIVAAGNRETDRAVTTRMPTPLRNRFTHLNFEVDMQEWCEWAVATNIRPEIIAFIRFKPELLSSFDRDANAFPSPRSWSFVSKILNQSPVADIEHELIVGTIGDGPATEFTEFLRTFRNLPNIEAILMDPEHEPVPSDASAQFAVASALSYRATDTNFDRIYRYIKRMPTEFGVLCVHDASRRQPDVKHTAAYTQWAVENHSVIS
jgi:hypothetical protein